MSHGLDQLTLSPPRPDLDSLVGSFGPYYTCLWCALEESTTVNAPIASDPAEVKQLLRYLRAAGIVLAESDCSSSLRRAIYQPISWSYAPPWDTDDSLARRLSVAMGRWRGDAGLQQRLDLWSRVSNAEILAYLANQLRRHGMSPQRSVDIVGMQEHHWFNLSVGRRRYVVWSGMRSAASAMLQYGMDEERAIIALGSEMKVRSRWLHLREREGHLGPKEFSFTPNVGWRRPIVIDVALNSLLGAGSDYGNLCPSVIR